MTGSSSTIKCTCLMSSFAEACTVRTVSSMFETIVCCLKSGSPSLDSIESSISPFSDPTLGDVTYVLAPFTLSEALSSLGLRSRIDTKSGAGLYLASVR